MDDRDDRDIHVSFEKVRLLTAEEKERRNVDFADVWKQVKKPYCYTMTLYPLTIGEGSEILGKSNG